MIPSCIKYDNKYYCYLKINWNSIRYYSPTENEYLIIPMYNGCLDKETEYESCDSTDFLIHNPYIVRGIDGIKCFKNLYSLLGEIDSNISDTEFRDKFFTKINDKLYNNYVADPVYRKIYNLSAVYKNFE